MNEKAPILPAPHMKRRTSVRERRFAKEAVKNGGDLILAAQSAGYAGNRNVLAKQASRLMVRPNVQSLLDAELEKICNPEERSAKHLGHWLNKEPGTLTLSETIKLLELNAKLRGHNKPSQSQQMIAKINLPS